jgi:hypothetical protein
MSSNYKRVPGLNKANESLALGSSTIQDADSKPEKRDIIYYSQDQYLAPISRLGMATMVHRYPGLILQFQGHVPHRQSQCIGSHLSLPQICAIVLSISLLHTKTNPHI